MGEVIAHENLKEAMDTFRLAYAGAVQRGKWMAAVWSLSDDGKVLLDCTTWDFPKEKLEEAKGELEKFCASEVSNQLPGGPLPFAEFLPLAPEKQDSPGNGQESVVKEACTVEFPGLDKGLKEIGLGADDSEVEETPELDIAEKTDETETID